MLKWLSGGERLSWKGHHITSHHITSHHITSHHITSHHITSHHITSHHITSHHITSQHSTSQHSTTHRNTSQHSTSQHSTNTSQHSTTHRNTAQSWVTSIACIGLVVSIHSNYAAMYNARTITSVRIYRVFWNPPRVLRAQDKIGVSIGDRGIWCVHRAC